MGKAISFGKRIDRWKASIFTKNTFDSDGKFRGRTDVTNHGRGDHPKPHYHDATGSNSANGPPISIYDRF